MEELVEELARVKEQMAQLAQLVRAQAQLAPLQNSIADADMNMHMFALDDINI